MKFVISSFGSFGDLNPYIGLGRALQERGHDVVLALPKFYHPFISEAGLKAHAVRPDIDPNDREIVRRVMDPLRGPRFLVRDLMMPVVEQSFEDLNAIVEDDDVLVSHPLTYAAPVLAEYRRLRWASSMLAPLGFFSVDDPPLVAVHPLVEALQRRFPALYRRFVHVSPRTTRSWSKPVRGLRARLGLPPGENPVHRGQFSPYLVLAMFSRVLAEVQPDWPTNTIVTGAVTYDKVLGGLSPALTAFLDRGPAPVVFTLGTAAVAGKTAAAFYRTSVDAAREAGARSVLLIGKDDGNRPDVEGRDDVFIADWAPHSELFGRAAVIVHQGGAGTLHTAMASGRPMIIVPHAHDQGDNAFRATRHGIGKVVFPAQYRRAVVRDHLRTLIQDPAYSSAAAEVASVVRAEHGATRCCEALEALAGRSNPSGRLAV